MRKTVLGVIAASLLAACGNGERGANMPSLLAGSVSAVPASTLPAAEIKTYAAARFLEHASFGPTPAAITDLKARGLAGWIDYQYTLPAAQIDATFAENWNSNDTPGDLAEPYYELFRREFGLLTLNDPAQLRLRTTWALSQFIVVNEGTVQSFGIAQYFNLLHANSLGNFADLLRAITLSPGMGQFLGNTQNRKTGACDTCALNENFSRELMQLFTLGVTRLNADGSVMRDAAGKPLETYTQNDVQAMARALTGWESVSLAPPGLRHSQHRYPLVESFKGSHDSEEKKLLGQTIAAGGTAAQDLDAVIKILMAHPNIAPFVSLRLIQHLVTSNPSPAYRTRIAAVFDNNGSGVKGDLKAVVRAILLDPEARAADDAAVQTPAIGKIREPALYVSALLRGLSCTKVLRSPDGHLQLTSHLQNPFDPASVFSFYPPTYLTPGSLLLAPEQKLLTSAEFNARLGMFNWTAEKAPQNFAAAGCNVDEFVNALSKSKRDFLNLASARFFRGAMAPNLRVAGDALLDQMNQANYFTPKLKTLTALQFLLTSPTFGVIK
ncbi:MAG: DUF1800 domain-containing protein [Pseudomonadota bacterium]